ncbi:MAG: Spy/CpxP family protein refolding chaperone [Pseudomonadota bacterium]
MKFGKTLITAILVAGSLGLALPLAAHARPFGGEHRGMHGGPGLFGGERMPRLLRGLGLTEAQRDKIFELMHAQAPAMRDKDKEIHKARAELHKLAFSAEYDEARVKALSEAAAAAMAEMAQMRARIEHQIYQLLTPEQRKTVEERKAAFEERRGNGGDGRGPVRG